MEFAGFRDSPATEIKNIMKNITPWTNGISCNWIKIYRYFETIQKLLRIRKDNCRCTEWQKLTRRLVRVWTQLFAKKVVQLFCQGGIVCFVRANVVEKERVSEREKSWGEWANSSRRHQHLWINKKDLAACRLGPWHIADDNDEWYCFLSHPIPEICRFKNVKHI